MTEGKRNIIAQLINEYDIQSADRYSRSFKRFTWGTIQEMLQSEMTEHLGYEEYQRSDNSNSRNGKKSKIIHSKYGETLIDVPQDREDFFELIIVKKTSKRYICHR